MQGELSNVWDTCKTQHGFPEINYEDTLLKIHGDEKTTSDFKEFLLCGLKQEQILTSEGTLNEDYLRKTLFGRHLLRKFAENQPEDKAEFAYQIARNYQH